MVTFIADDLGRGRSLELDFPRPRLPEKSVEGEEESAYVVGRLGDVSEVRNRHDC